jgi:hypothetical protein
MTEGVRLAGPPLCIVPLAWPERANAPDPGHADCKRGLSMRGRISIDVRFKDRVPRRILIGVCVALCGVLTFSGCTHANTSVAPGGGTMVVTEDQIEQLHATTAYDIVVQTHSAFLHSRGRESQDPNVPAIPVHVYVDDTYYGDVSSLRGISATVVMEIRLYQSYEAQYKFGSGHMGGVIQVITKI